MPRRQAPHTNPRGRASKFVLWSYRTSLLPFSSSLPFPLSQECPHPVIPAESASSLVSGTGRLSLLLPPPSPCRTRDPRNRDLRLVSRDRNFWCLSVCVCAWLLSLSQEGSLGTNPCGLTTGRLQRKALTPPVPQARSRRWRRFWPSVVDSCVHGTVEDDHAHRTMRILDTTGSKTLLERPRTHPAIHGPADGGQPV